LASFSDATWVDQADFSDATFSDWASFSGATFFGSANFLGATFSGLANFLRVTFSSHGTGFSGATFKKRAMFVNAEMKGPTLFEKATFSSEPPEFFGAKLHEKTVWRGVKWPLQPKNRKEAGWFVDAYERLKLEMDRLKKHEDELDFFALELQSRRVLHGNKRSLHGLAIALYGWLSDYGRSYVRPLTGLLITVLAGVLPFWWHLSQFWQAVGLSLANTFGVFGFRRELIGSEVLACLPGLLKVLAASQTVTGIVLLFLLGLAIRNRFRMK
jgi:hypothetical protein